jgi:hypothetical protein
MITYQHALSIQRTYVSYLSLGGSNMLVHGLILLTFLEVENHILLSS